MISLDKSQNFDEFKNPDHPSGLGFLNFMAKDKNSNVF